MALAPPRRRRWSRQEYHRMVEVGLLQDDDRVELLDGEIVEMSPPGPPHSAVITRANSLLLRIFGEAFYVRVQLPVALDKYSEPQPDFAVIRVQDLDDEEHPATALLVLEVSDSSLRYDRVRKSRAYARAGIPEYWIVNLRERQLEVQRDPDAAAGAYRERFVLDSEAEIEPLEAPGRRLRVEDLLPRRR